MPTSLVDSESVLALDLGSTHTRTILFDVVDGQYRFIALGTAPSTINAPLRDISNGLRQSLQSLQDVCGRTLLDKNNSLILPSSPDGSGVDRLVVTYSGGPELRVVIAGLLEDVSLQSSARLAASVCGKVAETIGFNDSRSLEAQIDAVVAAQPDLIILSGGTEKGASRSVLKLVDLIALVCQVQAENRRPVIFYTGNSALSKRIKDIFGKWTKVAIAPNIRPSIDLEDLEPAKEVLAKVIAQLRSDQIGGLSGLTGMGSVSPLPTSHAYGRIIRFLSQLYDPKRGVLGIDLGSASTVVAAAADGKLSLQVTPYGVGNSMHTVIQESSLEDFTRWIPFNIPEDMVRDILWQKTVYPDSIPASPEVMAVESSAVRQTLRLALRQAFKLSSDLPLAFEPVLAGGSVFTQTKNPAQSLLLLLDGLQPAGITTIVLDQHNLLPGLGAAAKFNSLLPVQVLESGAFASLGTVISPLCSARYDTKILRVRLEYEEGGEHEMEINKGSLTLLPLQNGQTARIHLEPLQRMQIDPYGGRQTHSFKITGGLCGAIIDTRGRPIDLPGDPTRRRELLLKWNKALGL